MDTAYCKSLDELNVPKKVICNETNYLSIYEIMFPLTDEISLIHKL